MKKARKTPAAAKPTPGRKKASDLDPSLLERMLYYLKLTREAESRIEQVLYRQGKIVGGVYVGRGQEAIGVGSAIQLLEGDVVLPSHRDFSCFLIRGFTLRQILCNWMGRANGPTRGRDHTSLIGDVRRGVIPIISHLGDSCPVACGVAMVLRRRRQGNVCLVHFGEGTSSRGDVHEAMNMAGVMKLPIIFICNNNAYAYSTPASKQYAIKDLAVRGAAYGMPGVVVDGNDVLAVHAVVAKAIASARRGGGPSFIECKTFRMTGHSAHDSADYVPSRLFKQWEKKDPITRLEKVMRVKRLLAAKQIAQMDAEVKRQVDDAVAYAESSPLPEGASAAEGVYCGPDCWWETSSH
jgi:TPP-dependent pyruvate/acetoin dehydrogenase alpha subunit